MNTAVTVVRYRLSYDFPLRTVTLCAWVWEGGDPTKPAYGCVSEAMDASLTTIITALEGENAWIIV